MLSKCHRPPVLLRQACMYINLRHCRACPDSVKSGLLHGSTRLALLAMWQIPNERLQMYLIAENVIVMSLLWHACFK